MKKLITVPPLLLFTIFISAQQTIDVLHYRFEIGLNDTSDIITGKASITLRFLKETDQLQLDLASAKENKGMAISSLMGTASDNKMLQHKQQNDKIITQLPQKTKTGDTATFIILYRGIPAAGLIISKNKYGHRTFFADNWPDRGHNWLPCVDDPADKASVEFIVTAPQHYQVVANGILTEETNLPDNKKLTHWKEDIPVATKVMVIGAADFAVTLAGVIDNCIPVYSWVYPEDRDKGFYDYALATEILPFFIKNVGPYGYKKLANVQSKTSFGGLENANTIFYSESSVTGTRIAESLLTHEIAHQWFGNMATEKSFAHIWLSEGFATYFTILYFEKKYGKDTATYMLKEDRKQVIAFVKRSDRTVVDNDPDYMQLLNANSYQKGGWILHMLRRQLGDSVFHRSIKTYYATYAGKNADTKDLQQIFEKISGKDMSVFFKQWLYTPGIPRLDIKWTWSDKDKEILLTVKQLQKPFFQFSLEIGIGLASGKIQFETMEVNQQEQTFSFSLKEKPQKLSLDPNTSLLFHGNITTAN